MATGTSADVVMSFLGAQPFTRTRPFSRRREASALCKFYPSSKPARAYMALLQAQDLVPLGRLFSSNVDDANFVGKMSDINTRLDALRRERQALEASSRRKQEMEVHLGRLKRLGIERRLAELSAAPAPLSAAARQGWGNGEQHASATVVDAAAAASMAARAEEAAAALAEARRRFAEAAQAAQPRLREARQEAHAAALARVREELGEVEARRGAAQQEFAEELKAQAELAREQQRLQLSRRLARGEGDAQVALRHSLFLSGGEVAPDAAPPPSVPAAAWSAAVSAAAQATAVDPVGGSTSMGVAPLAPVGALVGAALQSVGAPGAGAGTTAMPSATASATDEIGRAHV